MSRMNRQDRMVLVGIAALWAAAMGYGAYNGDAALAFVVGAVLMGTAVLAAVAGRGGLLSQIALPALGMGMVALSIHVARGHTESHFAVFAFLAVTIVYRRALPVIVAAGTVAVHHLSFNFFQQWGWGPICFTEPGLLKVIEHAAYVVAQASVMILLARSAGRDFAAGQSLIDLSERMVRQDGTVDFSMAAEPTPHPKAEPLVRALREADRALLEVRAAAQSVNATSSELAAGNLDLSVRTEQTASSLQLAASSMEEVTRNVQQTAESARTANQLASSAAEVAQRGGSVVEQVVATMGEIQESSRKIADIIGAIDGIAFQTNILALNAAVEAARAGEQGRGFAVVASEVRSLAGRSADAAKQIKSLIGASVERVENGSRLVADAGATMNEIVASVQRVNDMIGEITAATGEQTGGMLQINDAVSQLDKMTQRNAAMVEESSAAASSLGEQAGRLAEVVGRFQLTTDRLPAHGVAPAAAMPSEPATAAPAPAAHAARPRSPAARAPVQTQARGDARPAARTPAIPGKPAVKAGARPAAAAGAAATAATPAAGIELWPADSPAAPAPLPTREAAAGPGPAAAPASAATPPAAAKAPTLTDEWETF